MWDWEDGVDRIFDIVKSKIKDHKSLVVVK